MTLRIAVQMDPISEIEIAGDSTFALMLEAQARGHTLFYYRPDDLSLQGGDVVARGAPVSVFDKHGAHFELGETEAINLADVDVVLLRQDPPFDMSYMTTTYLLDRVHPKTLVVNDPTEVRNAPEKLLIFDYPDLIPPTLITRQLEDVRAFQRAHDDIILKPLFGNGGAGVFRIKPNDSNVSALVELFQALGREPFMVQQFRPEVRDGDKRVILVDGEIAGAINRVPPEGETRSNMHIGGTPEVTTLSKRDEEICTRLAPELKRRGLIFTGIDVIGDYLTEINVTSPTGIRQVKAFGGADIAAMIWDVIEKKL